MHLKTCSWVPSLLHKLSLTDIIQLSIATICGEIAFVIVWRNKKPIDRLVALTTIT